MALTFDVLKTLAIAAVKKELVGLRMSNSRSNGRAASAVPCPRLVLARRSPRRYVPAGNEMDRKERQFSEFPGYRKYRQVSQEVYSGDGGNVLMSPLRLDVSFRLPVHLIVRWLLRLRTG